MTPANMRKITQAKVFRCILDNCNWLDDGANGCVIDLCSLMFTDDDLWTTSTPQTRFTLT